uniref:Galactosyltransferase N-terminal domain-containing protein n=1 Tax=Meloidogyne incognita TaxID=6306 RepID=A0A914MTS7_MELIC
MGNEGKGEDKRIENKDEERDKIEVKNEVRSQESGEKIKIENKQDKTESTTITTPKNIILNQQIKTKNNNDDTQLIQIAQLWRVKQDNLTLCPEKPPNLKGKIDVDMRSLKLEEIEEEYKDLWPGGHWRPKECKSRQKVAIVVPYRNREPHLRTFLHNIHRFLQKQQLDYAIFVVEQIGDFAFNKGRLTNIGVLEVTFFLWRTSA